MRQGGAIGRPDCEWGDEPFDLDVARVRGEAVAEVARLTESPYVLQRGFWYLESLRDQAVNT